MPVAPACLAFSSETGSCGPNQRHVSFILHLAISASLLKTLGCLQTLFLVSLGIGVARIQNCKCAVRLRCNLDVVARILRFMGIGDERFGCVVIFPGSD